MKKILIFGAGQLGSRYLQGLRSVTLDLCILVVDKSNHSLGTAKERWIEVGGDQSPHKIKWCQELPKDSNMFDLIIVTTPSKSRVTIIKEISNKVSGRYWLLEKVLAQSKQDLDTIQFETASAKGVWVNTPRRLMNWHQKLKLKFSDQGPINVKKIGGLWGLACNTIHFIDLVAWWTNESLLSINISKLDPTWFKSKRPGYFEVTGKLFAKFSKGTELVLHSHADIVEDIIIVELDNKDVWVINEDKGIASETKKGILNGRLELQSEMTKFVVTKILVEGTCNLPTLKESSQQHSIFLDSMLKHWNYSNNCNVKKVPIT